MKIQGQHRSLSTLALWKALLIVLFFGSVLASMLVMPDASVALAQAAVDPPSVDSTADSGGWGDSLRRILWIFLLLSIGGLVLLIGTVLFLIWRAKKLVENAVKADLPALERLVERIRQKHPELDEKSLCKKLIHRQATRAGLVGFVTGLGGLPALPIAIPIDLAATVKLQSNLVHMLRIASGGRVQAEEVSEASLWLITSGGQELAVASGTMIRELIVKLLSKSLLKFVPIIGGLVGFVLNWASTQTLGRLSLSWLEGQATAETSAPRPDLPVA